MQPIGYQSPELWILAFEKEDVIKTSEPITLDPEKYDKGVADLF